MATEVLVPPLGQTVDTVTLATWYKNEGDSVKQGEMLFAIETDKATLDVEAPASGVLRRVTARAGDAVAALTAIAVIAGPEEVVDRALRPDREVEASPAREVGGWGDGVDASLARQDRAGTQGRIFISPRARRLAEQHHIPLAALQATGPEGAIVERDVMAYLERLETPSITPVARRLAEGEGINWRELAGSGPGGRITREDVTRALAPPQTEAPGAVSEGQPVAPFNEPLEIIPVRSVRAVIAERLLQSSRNSAQVTLTAEADATALVELRRSLAGDGVETSYSDLFLYVLGRALKEHPQLNASLEGDTIKTWRRIHIGLAVDTERGLLAPVVRDVAGKGIAQLAGETQALIDRARAGQCLPEELQGGTFTLTNLGMYGIDAFTPLLNLPECAILGVGRITTQPAIVDGQVVGRERVWLSLTFDHRLIDGGPAARFLQRVVQLVERPHLLLA